MNDLTHIPTVSVHYGTTGASTSLNELGMRVMQERAFNKRGEQYLLIKSPPASGKSRALMFIALHKVVNQGLKQAIIVVPEKSIGASFNNEPLSAFGFWADWQIEPRWNLCNAPGEDKSKVAAVKSFLESDDKNLVCTHATFRFAVDQYGIEAFDNRLIAVDEFHHVSANPDNKLGNHLHDFIERGKVHITAMTGSYFRGDGDAVLHPDDEARFETVTYTYYEQLNGYEYLKTLDIGYYFYSGAYADDIGKVLDPRKKTIIHIPNVNSAATTGNKYTEVDAIMENLGDWQGVDEKTGFHLLKQPDGSLLKIADLVSDGTERAKVDAALADPEQKNNREHVDIIIALGKAKEGFDWIWCEHALTIGYRSSLTEIVQIIGRATRDAPYKTHARFTNLIAEPDAETSSVAEAVNDTLKAIAASLLMEQVLAPRFDFKPKHTQNGPTPGFDYGEEGYQEDKTNVGYNPETGQIQMELKGLSEPKSHEAKRICKEDLNELVTAIVQDKQAIERGMFDTEMVPQELTQVRIGKIVGEKYPQLDDGDKEAVRQHVVAAVNATQQAKKIINDTPSVLDEPNMLGEERAPYQAGDDNSPKLNTAFIDGVRRFAVDVRELSVDLIDSINPFGEAYNILAKTMSEERLRQVAAVIAAKRINLTEEEARDLAKRAVQFKNDKGRLPSLTASDPWEKRMAEGIEFIKKKTAEKKVAESSL